MDLPNSDDEQSRWLSPDPPSQDNLLRVRQMSPGSDDIVLSYPKQLVSDKDKRNHGKLLTAKGWVIINPLSRALLCMTGDDVVKLQLLEDENRQPAEARCDSLFCHAVPS